MIAVGVVLLAYFYYNSKFGARKNKAPSPIVRTKNGQLVGITSLSRDGKKFYEYNGIPYAKPPVGELRYEVNTFDDNVRRL